jgi:hypothetical protein
MDVMYVCMDVMYAWMDVMYVMYAWMDVMYVMYAWMDVMYVCIMLVPAQDCTAFPTVREGSVIRYPDYRLTGHLVTIPHYTE